jgi:uncharacterized membrane protein YccC
VKSLRIAGIVVGIVTLVLGLLGILGSGTNLRGLMAAAVVVIAAGFILYRRGQRRTSV